MHQDIRIGFVPVTFAELAGWGRDDHVAAYDAFRRSCPAVLRQARDNSGRAGPGIPAELAEVCDAVIRNDRTPAPGEARTFFETRFRPHRVEHAGAPGLLTAYYEPVLEGSRERDGPFTVPVYARPPELVTLVDEAERSAIAGRLTHARKTASGFEPYFTRAEIEDGALAGRGLELLWLTDPVEAFVLHIQGSGRIRLPDGSMIRITYDGKNGYPYTSVGRYLIETRQLPVDFATLDAMTEWLRADARRGSAVMHQNASFIFFREMLGAEAENAMGVMDIPLTPGRSLALDTAFHDIGIPVWVAAPEIDHLSGPGGFHRLMVSQDVGSAIKGPERGDLYLGSGEEAGRLAGMTKHPGNFYVLLAERAGSGPGVGTVNSGRRAAP